MSAANESNAVILRAFLANLGIAIAKFVGASMTGSAAMRAEGVHSLVDTVNQLLLFYGQKQAQKPADALHPLGYAREQYFWTFIVGLLIFSLGGGIALYEGIGQLNHPEATVSPHIALSILGVALLLEGWSLIAALRAFNAARGELSFWSSVKESRDTVTVSILLEDLAAVAGLILAAAGIILELVTGDPVWDAVASIMIGLVLGTVSLILLIKAKHLLIGQTADAEVSTRVRQLVEGEAGVDKVREVISIQLSVEHVMVIIDIDFDDAMRMGEVEQRFAEIKRKVMQAIPAISRIYISETSGDFPANDAAV